MKKLILSLLLVVACATFTNAAAVNMKVSFDTPVINKSYTVNELLASNAKVEFITNLKLVDVQRVSTGNVTDGNGNVIGWWAYDSNSGVLLIYLY